MNGYIAVDLDGTLALYDGWKGIEHIGEPVPLMLNRVKKWLSKGIEVKIFTARVCDGKQETIDYIHKWCSKHIGRVLEVTNVKDYKMVALWDDRAKQVIPNEGIAIEDMLKDKSSEKIVKIINDFIVKTLEDKTVSE